MNYVNIDINRQDRLLPHEDAIRLLKKADYGVLSMVDKSLQAYGIPLCFVWDNCDSIYFHCSHKGKKMKCVHENKSVSFCIVSDNRIVPEKFTMNYLSVIVKGEISFILSEKEKWKAVSLIIEKYLPSNKASGVEYAKRAFERTCIIKLSISSISGKANNIS